MRDRQVGLALRDNAAKLFRERLAALLPGTDADRAALTEARAYQLQVSLPDDAAAEIIQARALAMR